jgi:hypothetical protein
MRLGDPAAGIEAVQLEVGAQELAGVVPHLGEALDRHVGNRWLVGEFRQVSNLAQHVGIERRQHVFAEPIGQPREAALINLFGAVRRVAPLRRLGPVLRDRPAERADREPGQARPGDGRREVGGDQRVIGLQKFARTRRPGRRMRFLSSLARSAAP